MEVSHKNDVLARPATEHLVTLSSHTRMTGSRQGATTAAGAGFLTSLSAAA